MNDQFSTVGAGQDVSTRGQCGPGEVVFEQRVAGRFLEFSLSHPARSATAVVQQRERPRRSVTANQSAPCLGQPRSLPQEDLERGGGGLTRPVRGRYGVPVATLSMSVDLDRPPSGTKLLDLGAQNGPGLLQQVEQLFGEFL